MTTPIHALPEVAQGQNNAEQLHNLALSIVDAILGSQLVRRDLTAPPGGESNGQVWLIGGTGSGDWTGHDDEIAVYVSGWYFVSPREGMRFWIANENLEIVYDGSTWVAPTVDDLTDSTGATPDETIAAVSTAVTGVDGTGSNAASKADVDARLSDINDNFSDLLTKLNEALAALREKGILDT